MSKKRSNPYVGDSKTQEAKAKGYPARSVFKLQEIDKRTQLFKGGMHVIDLGAAPGSWSLYASQKVGQNGRVLAIDLQEIQQRFDKNVTVVQGDAFDVSGEVLNTFAPYDVVLSDMAPRTSGVRLRDQAGSFELYLRALEVGAELGKVGSTFVAKLFMGPDFDEAVAKTKIYYSKVRVIRPEGVRQVSKEIFIVGQGRREKPLGGAATPDDSEPSSTT